MILTSNIGVMYILERVEVPSLMPNNRRIYRMNKGIFKVPLLAAKLFFPGIISALPTTLAQQFDITDNHGFIHGFAHIINSKCGN